MQFSIVNYLEVIKHWDTRMDSEYYRPICIQNNKTILKHNVRCMQYFIQDISGGATPLGANYYTNGIPFLRVQNIMQNYIDDSNIVYINQAQNDKLSRSKLKYRDVLLTITGSYGKSAVVPEKFEGSNINQHSVKITVRDISPYFLSVFLNCRYGYIQSSRHIVGITRPAIDYTAIKSFLIPYFSYRLQNIVEEVYVLAEKTNIKSYKKYQQAERLLLEELGLLDYKAKHTLTFVKNFSDTKEAGRIDAEYFQPKYDKIIKFIKDYKNGWNTLEDLCLLVGHPSNPPYSEIDAENKTFIVAQKHMGDYCLSDDYWNANDAKYTNNRFVEKNKQYILQKEDLVLYTVGAPPHIGKANLIFEETIPSTIGSFVTLVRVNKEKINPYYLVVLLNSTIGPQLTNRFQCGMVQQYIYPKDLVKIIIPLLPKEKQLEIQQKVTESFQLRKQSKQLLEIAKKGVEKAIEQDEEKALSWMDKEVKKLGLP